ncbi:hypothetical protein OG747_16035 [Streptomyces sp. NBC_01384]|uniref:hypothetical protein n=1 Tax=Streptomyces sp. NBC_01384 TaxID=2903847 RepID=UPI003249E28B
MTRFDHRVVAVVSIKGLRTDRELFEKAREGKGWSILEQPRHPTGTPRAPHGHPAGTPRAP